MISCLGVCVWFNILLVVAKSSFYCKQTILRPIVPPGLLSKLAADWVTWHFCSVHCFFVNLWVLNIFFLMWSIYCNGLTIQLKYLVHFKMYQLRLNKHDMNSEDKGCGGGYLEIASKGKERKGCGSEIGDQMCGNVAICWLLLLALRTQTSTHPIGYHPHRLPFGPPSTRLPWWYQCSANHHYTCS